MSVSWFLEHKWKGNEDKSGRQKWSSRIPRVATAPIHCGGGDFGEQVLRLPRTQLLYKRTCQAGGWGHRRCLLPQVNNPMLSQIYFDPAGRMVASRDDDVVLRKDPNWYTSASSWLMVRKEVQRGSKETHVLSFFKTPENYRCNSGDSLGSSIPSHLGPRSLRRTGPLHHWSNHDVTSKKSLGI